MSRLTIDVTDQQHQRLEALAALQGKTVKEYAVEKLFSADDDAARALMELDTLLRLRMEDVASGDLDPRSFKEIAEAVLNSRGAAM